MMKVYFYSEDQSDGELADQALSFEASVVSPGEAPSASEGDVVVIDHALGKKAILKLIEDNPGPVYVMFYNSIKSKELKEIEGSKHAPHACLKRPVSEDFLLDIVQDFLEDSSTGKSSGAGDKTGTKSGLNELTFIGMKKPEGLNKKVEKESLDFDEGEVDSSNDEEDDENSDVPMQEFKMSNDIKEIIKMHSLSKDKTPNFDSEENQQIQRKFDLIFPDESFPARSKDGANFAPIDEDLLKGIAEDIKPIENVSLDFEGEVEDLTSKEGSAKIKVSMEEDLPNNVTPINKEKNDKKAKEDSMSDSKENKDDLSLTFDLGADLDSELMDKKEEVKSSPAPSKSAPAPAADTESADIGMDLDFGAEEKIGSATSSGETEKLPEANDLEIGNEEPDEGATTVFKGASVEMALSGGDDLLIESSGSGEGESTKTATSDDLSAGGDGIELEGSGGDDLDIDLGDSSEDPTKISAKKEADENNQEFDYKSSIHKTEKLQSKKSKEDEELNLDEDINLDDGDELEKSLEENRKNDSSDDSLDDISFGDEDAPTKVFSSGDVKKAPAKKAKKEETFDVTEELEDADEDSSPLIIGMDKIPTASLSENDLVRLQSTTRHLKEERELLLKEIDRLKEQKREVAQDNLSLKTENDDLRIEISILRKRHEKDLEDVKMQLKTHEERKALYEEKLKIYQKEIEKLNHKLRVDFGKVKQREKELESQLELQSMDSENQIKSRDKKILDLKRKIDSLEFNMENASIREQKFREDKVKLEDRMNKIMHTLRNSIQVIEDDLDLDEETMEKLGK